MRTPYVSLSNVVFDFAVDNGIDHQETENISLMKWGVDALNMMALTEQLRNKVVLLRVENSRAELPEDFKILLQASANVWDKRNKVKTRREDIIQWVHGTYESDCKLKIDLICDKCHKETPKCGCGENALQKPIVVDVDRAWEMAHPEIYYRHYRKVGRFGYGPQPGSEYSSRFELMRATSHDYFRANLILGDCPNVDCRECAHTFRLDLPYIEVDFQDGEVLLGYLGRILDSDGNLMIPDHPDVHEAILYHLEYKWYSREWKRNNDQFANQKAKDALQLREDCMGKAKSALDMPEYKEAQAWIDNDFLKRLPDLNHDANMGARTPDLYDRYKNHMKY